VLKTSVRLKDWTSSMNDIDVPRDNEIVGKICNLVFTILLDDRLPVEMREEYRKLIYTDYKVIPFMANDLIQEYLKK
jgi:hypothetical protein